jgi:hypothetical protein
MFFPLFVSVFVGILAISGAAQSLMPHDLTGTITNPTGGVLADATNHVRKQAISMPSAFVPRPNLARRAKIAVLTI